VDIVVVLVIFIGLFVISCNLVAYFLGLSPRDLSRYNSLVAITRCLSICYFGVLKCGDIAVVEAQMDPSAVSQYWLATLFPLLVSNLPFNRHSTSESSCLARAWLWEMLRKSRVSPRPLNKV